MFDEKYNLRSHSLLSILYLLVISFSLGPNILSSSNFSFIVSKHHIIDMFKFVLAILV